MDLRIFDGCAERFCHLNSPLKRDIFYQHDNFLAPHIAQ